MFYIPQIRINTQMFNKIFTIMKTYKCYLLVHRAQNFVVAVFSNKKTAIDAVNKLNSISGLPMYGIIKKQLFLE